VLGPALQRICELLLRDCGRSFYSRGPAELKELSPTERSVNKGVARLRQSAE